MYDALSHANLSSLSSLPSEDTEIKLEEVKGKSTSYVAGGEKQTGAFSSAKMFFNAIFRSDPERKSNNAVFTRVKQDIQNVFGEQAAEAFENEMSSKIGMGSPLTKGALVRFMSAQRLSLNPKEVAIRKFAQAMYNIDTAENQLPQMKQASFNKLCSSLSNDERKFINSSNSTDIRGQITLFNQNNSVDDIVAMLGGGVMPPMPGPESFNANEGDIKTALQEIKTTLNDVKKEYAETIGASFRGITPETILAKKQKSMTPLARCITQETLKSDIKGWIGSSLRAIQSGKGSLETAMTDKNILHLNSAVITAVAGGGDKGAAVTEKMQKQVDAASSKQKQESAKATAEVRGRNEAAKTGKKPGMLSGFFGGGK